MRQPISPVPFLTQIPDWRDHKRSTYPWNALWVVVLIGLMAGPENILALSQWIQLQREELMQCLKLQDVPRQATIYRFFWKLDAHLPQLKAALLAWVKQQCPEMQDRVAVLAGDGKVLKGSARESQSALSFLSDFFHDLSLTVTQVEQGGRHEAKALQDLLADLNTLFGESWLLTLDAAYTEQHLTSQVIAAGGDYLVPLKNNTKALKEWAVIAFSYPTENVVVDIEHRNGEVWERRTAILTDVPEAIRAALPDVKTLIRREHRVTRRNGKRTVEVRYAVSSMLLTARQAEDIWRGHWGIENRSHHARDTVLHEDRCRMRRGAQGRAALNGVVLGILLNHSRSLTAVVRQIRVKPIFGLRLLLPELG